MYNEINYFKNGDVKKSRSYRYFILLELWFIKISPLGKIVVFAYKIKIFAGIWSLDLLSLAFKRITVRILYTAKP